jgi:hypothetical protein
VITEREYRGKGLWHGLRCRTVRGHSSSWSPTELEHVP